MIFFLCYSLVTRILRINAIRVDGPLAVEKLINEGKSRKEIEEFEQEHWWVRFSMACTAFLTFTMLLGVCKYRVFFYIIPWAICLDKAIEYPIYPVLSDYANTFLAFFSQSSIF